MIHIFNDVTVSCVNENGQIKRKYSEPVLLRTDYDPEGLLISFLSKDEPNPQQSTSKLFGTLLENSSPPVRVGKCGFVISDEKEALLFKLASEKDAISLQVQLTKALKGNKASIFDQRTEDSSALQYFQFYGYLSQQQNMMQDYIRTATYQKAILSNMRDFTDKVVLDVGAGSGILSFFAVQAGAKKVYAVEASSMAAHAEGLSNYNGLKGKLIVLAGKIEDVELPEQVDAIISEPMGYMLFNERMLETYLHAKKWLKPGGKMFPSRGDLHVAPFTDDALFLEQCNKANFWQQNCFHGVDLSCLRNAALKEYFCQPIVDTFDVRICLAKTVKHVVDFTTASEFDLHHIEIPLEFPILETGAIHGLAFWFDVAFEGSQSTIWLSTSPTEPLTHWYQVRCLIDTPILAKQGDILKGRTVLSANKRQSYDVLIDLELNGVTARNTLDLKNPYFRYTGQAPQPPPGHHSQSPSDAIWTTVDNGGRLLNGVATVNGSLVDEMGNLVEMSSPNQMLGVLPGGVSAHQIQTNAQMAHYTALPIQALPQLGEYVAAAGGQSQVLLTNSNVNVLPSSPHHTLQWSH